MRTPNASFRSFRKAPRGRAGPVVALILLLIAAPRPVPAQHQVNPMVNNSVNRQLYGGGGPSGCINFAGTPGGIQAKSSVMMNSEFKYAAWKSGATRSDIKMGYAALGPRATGGPQSYINYSPTYLAKNTPSKSPPAPQGSSAFTTGSVRYSSAKPASSFGQSSTSSMGVTTPSLKPISPTMSSTPSLKPTSPTMSSSGLSSPSGSKSSIRYSH